MIAAAARRKTVPTPAAAKNGSEKIAHAAAFARLKRRTSVTSGEGIPAKNHVGVLRNHANRAIPRRIRGSGRVAANRIKVSTVLLLPERNDPL